MIRPTVVLDCFDQHYQIFAHTYAKSHPAANAKRFSCAILAEAFFRSLRVPDNHWRCLLGETTEFDSSCRKRHPLERVALLCTQDRIRVYKLPSLEALPSAHNGVGSAFGFASGDPLPHLARFYHPVGDRGEAGALVSGLKTGSGFWSGILLKHGLIGEEWHDATPTELQLLAVEMIIEGRLCVYRTPYHPPVISAKSSAGDVESQSRKPVPLAPPSKTDKQPAVKKPAAAPLKPVSKLESLDDAAQLLAARREQIKKEGYQQKYTDEELKAIAAKGEVTDRFLVRLIFGKEKDTRDGTLGFARESGRAPYWATTLDMAEAADSDPEILAGLFGIENFDPEQPFTLAIIDMEKMPPQAERQSFIPTFEKMKEFGEKEFTEKEGFKPDTMSKIMDDEFAREYLEFMEDFGTTGESPYDPLAIQEHSEKFTDKIEKQKLIQVRHTIQLELGANSLFSGNGLTKVTPGSRYASEIGQDYGVVETFTFERDPLTIQDLEGKNAIKIISAQPIKD